MLRLFSTGAVILISSMALALQTPPAASIEGTVLASGSGIPLSRAQLTLTRVDLQNPRPNGKLPIVDVNAPPNPRPVFTDSEGRFALRNVPPGHYKLMAERNGYVPQSYGQRSTEGDGILLQVIASESKKGIIFRLIQGAVISGRVRDTQSEPLTGIRVALLRMTFDENGKRILTTVREASTDDRGEYRIFWIPPGRYYVRAARSPDNTADGVLRIVADKVVQTVYYPGSLDPAGALPIELQAGSELTTIDFVAPNPSGHRVRGRVIDSATGKPARNVSIGLAPRQSAVALSDSDSFNSTDYDPSTGLFEIQNVVPGVYSLAATTWGAFDQPLSPDAIEEVRTGKDLFTAMFSGGSVAETQLDMQASDVDGIVLTLNRGIPIPARISIETNGNFPVSGLDDIRALLTSELNLLGRGSTRFNAQGTARIQDVLPGEYRASVEMEPSTPLYVKQIRYGRTDALREPIQVRADSTDTLSITLSMKGAEIEGTVTDGLNQSALAGSTVVLIPDQREFKYLYRHTTTDANGRFSFRAVAPGDYRVLSWEGLEPHGYYDADLLSQQLSQARPVQVQELEVKTVDLRVTLPKP